MIKEIFSETHRVSLQDITAETLRPILKLEVGENQKQFVAPNAVSVAQAYYEKNAWFKGIYVKELPVGFVMLELDEVKEEYFLWRFMIDQRYQGLGYGKEAIELIMAYVETLPGAKKLLTSCVPGEGSPEGFYEKLGFVFTNEWADNEKIYALSFPETHPNSIHSHENLETEYDEVDLIIHTAAPEPDALYELYESLQWTQNLKITPETLMQSMSGSYRVVYAYADKKLVGTGRLISDGVINTYLCGVGVHPEFQGQGIGKAICETLISYGKANGLQIQLFCSEKLIPYYEALHFKKFAEGMKLMD